MSFLRKSLGRNSDSRLKKTSSTNSLPPWAGEQQKEDEKKKLEAQAESDRRRLLNVNRYAGVSGAPAFTKMRKQEQSRVETMQNHTFTRWVNLQLASAGVQPVPGLVEGFATGENLLRLLSALSGKTPASLRHPPPAFISASSFCLTILSSVRVLESSKEVDAKNTGKSKCVLPSSLVELYQVRSPRF